MNQIKLTTYKDGVEAAAKWENRRLCVFFHYEKMSYSFYFKKLLVNEKELESALKGNHYHTEVINNKISEFSFGLSSKAVEMLISCIVSINNYLQNENT
jgi:thioredoxin-related protein